MPRASDRHSYLANKTLRRLIRRVQDVRVWAAGRACVFGWQDHGRLGVLPVVEHVNDGR